MLQNTQLNEDEGIEVSTSLFAFLTIGVALVFIGIVVLVVASVVLGGSGTVGVVIFVGPFPIVLGNGPDAVWLISIGIIIAVLSTVLFLIMNRRFQGLKAEEIY